MLSSARLGSFARRFVFTPAPPQGLGALRLGIAFVGLVQLWILQPHLPLLYGNFGLVQWAVLETSNDVWLPSIGKLCLALQPLSVSSAGCVDGVFGIYGLSLLGLAIGWKTRAFAVVAWLSHSLTINTGYFSLYGVDTMIHVCLFYFVWMPVGAAFSIDAIRRPASPSVEAGVALRVLQIHLCIIYLDSGTAKLLGEEWRSGEALWQALMNPEFAVFDVSWLAQVPVIAAFAAWIAILTEVGYAVFIWPRRTRPYWIAATVALHLGIGVLMGLWMFSVTMILMTVCAFAPPLFLRSSSD